MNPAAEAIASALRSSGARRVAFLGLAKNVGKTTALVSVLDALARAGRPAAATSAGRDGEAIDALTGDPKPRFRLAAGQLVASARSTFASATFAARFLAEFPFVTRFGPIELRRAEQGGTIEVIGPSTASQLARVAQAMERAGAEHVLIDGAFGRRAFASGRVSHGIVLSAGMAAGPSIDVVLAFLARAIALISLPETPDPERARTFSGALTDDALRRLAPEPRSTLVIDDFASVFLSPAALDRLGARGVRLSVRRQQPLLGVTANPAAPGRATLEPGPFLEAVRRVVPQTVPVFDVVAGLVR
jgi:hypothetical protein